ncbi:MAG: hypothetical protein LKKZDAJK_001799 [Candidatus Fervidibacter sp.]
MRKEIPLPLAIGIIVVVLAVVGFFFWRALFKPRETELKPQEVPPVLKEIMGPRRSP